MLQQLKQEAHRYESETNPPSSPPLLPSKHQIISILAAQGHWVTSQPDLQVTNNCFHFGNPITSVECFVGKNCQTPKFANTVKMHNIFARNTKP